MPKYRGPKRRKEAAHMLARPSGASVQSMVLDAPGGVLYLGKQDTHIQRVMLASLLRASQQEDPAGAL